MRSTVERLLAGAAVALVLGVVTHSQGFAQSKPGQTATPQTVPVAPPAAVINVPQSDTPRTTGSTVPSAAPAEPSVAAPAAPPPAQTPAAKDADTKPASNVAVPAPEKAPAPAETPAASTKPAETPAAAAPAATPTPDASAKVEPPKPAATKDGQVADLLRELGNGKFDRLLGKKERVAIEAFYSARNFAPLWITDGLANARAKAAMGYLAKVDADGLDPADYPMPVFKDGLEPDALAEAELRFTQSVLTYARHAQRGRVHYSRVSADIEYQLPAVEPADILGKLATSSDVAATLDGFEPQHPGYKALKAKLAEARHITPGSETKRLPSGPALKYAKDKKGKVIITEDPRVPLLRERLNIEGDAASLAYDKTVADAVAKFQKAHGLPPNGQLTAATVEAINGPRRDRDADIIMVNMERWRWLPRDLGKDHVMVNIPDFTLRLMHDGKLYWMTKIVTGKPGLPTPLISAEMKFITVNPTWNVPPSIIKNEYLPALQQDPNALARIGLKVEHNRDGTLRIYQPPGDRNALGRIRFNFPNKFLVYQHDTPDKHLFAHAKRAYSHGCMRVENPLMYGEKLLSLVLPNEHYTTERLRKMFGGSEVNINFPRSIPVHITYQTAFVDDDGKLQIREDVYGRDAKMLAILKGTEHKIADVAVDRPRSTSTAPVRAPNGVANTANYQRNNPSLFDFFFSNPQPQPAQRSPRRASRNNQSVR